MAMCRSGLLLRLNVNSSNRVVRQPEMMRATGWMRCGQGVAGKMQENAKGLSDRASCDIESDDVGTLQDLV